MTQTYGNYLIHTMHFPIWSHGDYTKYLTLSLFVQLDGYYIVWSDDFGFLCASKVLDL